MALELNTHSDV